MLLLLFWTRSFNNASMSTSSEHELCRPWERCWCRVTREKNSRRLRHPPEPRSLTAVSARRLKNEHSRPAGRSAKNGSKCAHSRQFSAVSGPSYWALHHNRHVKNLVHKLHLRKIDGFLHGLSRTAGTCRCRSQERPPNSFLHCLGHDLVVETSTGASTTFPKHCTCEVSRFLHSLALRVPFSLTQLEGPTLCRRTEPEKRTARTCTACMVTRTSTTGGTTSWIFGTAGLPTVLGW